MAPLAAVTLVGADTVAPVDVHPTEIVSPDEGAGPESPTVHWDDPGAVTAVGLQDRAFSEADAVGALIVTVVPDPVAAKAVPEPETASGLTNPMALDFEDVVLERVKLAVARVPSAILLVLRPTMRQVY